jgi:hypothetical protein
MPLPRRCALSTTPVQATGTYDFAQEIVLRNRSYSEVAGVL